jgi:RNA polymerase sigma factor (sigma-70 family)
MENNERRMTTSDHRSDIELLRAYERNGDEAAFGALAARHVDMIFAVSLRRSGNRQLAEEATQNVLIALCKNSRKFNAPESNLTAWLHTSTKFEIAKLQRRESRIKRREQAYATENMNTTTQDDDETFRRLLPLLDQAIDQLRAPDREVIVRRYLEGHDFRRIGEALGISEDAAQKRTSRAFDVLNQFFKRKAGVSVSATALAAGIGQHCIEAAPAACLQFTAATASTGLASLLTTATIATMSLTKITAITTTAVVAIGGAIALLNSGEKTSPETIATSASTSANPNVSPTPQPSNKNETVTTSTADTNTAADSEKPYSPNEELAKLEAMSPHPSPDEMARRLTVKHEQLLKDLTDELGLSEEQMASLKAVLDARVKTFRASLDRQGEPDAEKQMITKAGSLIRGVGLREALVSILSEKQLASFDERESKTLQSQAESLSYRELSTLTPVLKLSEEQKDKVFELLQTSSKENLKQSGDARAFMALMQNKTITQVDFTSMADADFFHEIMDGPNALPPDSPEFKTRIIEFVTTQTNKQVELLSPALDPAQKKRYHDHLISKSMLPMFGIELPAPKEK